MDGQGSEHSSGRLERFLSLSDDNISVVLPDRSSKLKRQIRNCNWQVNIIIKYIFFYI